MLRLMLAYTDPGSGSMFGAYQFWGVIVFIATMGFFIWAATSRKNNK